MPPDIVYPLRRGKTEELRYSLRSLRNLPHGRVWLVGHRPEWVQGVEYIPRIQNGTKYVNATMNLVKAAEHPDISDPFILFNDDFYVMRRMRKLPTLNRGRAIEVIHQHRIYRPGPYIRGMVQTYRMLKFMRLGWELFSYELHLPILIHKAPLLEAWERGQHLEVLHIRTAYGNIANLGGESVPDCKVYRANETGWESWPFLSSNDNMNTPVGRFLKRKFRAPSRYERTG